MEKLLIAIGGQTGSGKSTFSYYLKYDFFKNIKSYILDYDFLLKKLFNKKMSDELEEFYYTEENKIYLKNEAEKLTKLLFKSYDIIINPSGFWLNESRKDIEKFAKENNYRLIKCWLYCDRRIIESRIKKRIDFIENTNIDNLNEEFINDNGFASDGRIPVLEKYPINGDMDMDWLKINSDNNVENIAKELFKNLNM